MKKMNALVLGLLCALGLVGCSKEAASIGIIGGADGPTAIFVTSNTNWMNICALICLIVVAILVAFIIYHNKNKK